MSERSVQGLHLAAWSLPGEKFFHTNGILFLIRPRSDQFGNSSSSVWGLRTLKMAVHWCYHPGDPSGVPLGAVRRGWLGVGEDAVQDDLPVPFDGRG